MPKLALTLNITIMIRLEVIGNLGADAIQKNDNGHSYIHFRVAHTDKFTDLQSGQVKETTTWISCFYSGRAEAILPYLTTGTKVFVRGHVTLAVYSSPKTHAMEAGITMRVSELELCGGMNKIEKQTVEDARIIVQAVQDKGYKTIDEIPGRN